ncbi:hypothetical protein [Desulfurococcus amylolyticus]|nr:hypothetical protein [Desulfurococcus amylolyticus]
MSLPLLFFPFFLFPLLLPFFFPFFLKPYLHYSYTSPRIKDYFES